MREYYRNARRVGENLGVAGKTGKTAGFRKQEKRIFFVVSVIWLFCCCRGLPTQEEVFSQEEIASQVPSTVKIAGDIEAQKNILLAFAAAYPDKIKSVEFLNNDWTMAVNSKRFYYAHGRFLPEELRERWEEYQPYDFYAYPWTGTDRQRRLTFAHTVYSVGSSFLLDALYASPNEDDSWDLQEKYSFLGVKMLIHPYIKPMLSRVEEQVRIAARTDSSINEWIAELQTTSITGWYWRAIAGTNRRSNHSYGIAIDLLPRELKGRRTYWLWDIANKTSHENYYLPPGAVIKIFEDNGFIWGGKWDTYDTMHFEYRPEILLLNNYIIEKQ